METQEPNQEHKKTGQAAPAELAKKVDTTTIHRRSTLILLAGGLVVLALGFSAGWMSRAEHTPRNFGDKIEVLSGAGPRGGMMHGFGGPGGDVNPTDGTTSTRLNGVVTQVNGETIVIAGNGTSKTIKTTADTTYSTDAKSVKVNDSVVVKGVQSGDTFTASTVTVLNR